MDRVFLDANVLFSAAYSEGAGLALLWKLPSVELITSSYAIEETRRNLKLDDQQARLNSLLAALLVVFEEPVTSIVVTDSGLPPKDLPILSAAIAGQATHLLTGDLRHFKPLFGSTIGGVLIQKPADYLRGKGGGQDQPFERDR